MAGTVYTGGAAVISLAIGVAAAQAGWRLVVVVLVAGWVRWIHILVRVNHRLVPQRLAEIALDDRWREHGWDGSEGVVLDELVAVSSGNRRMLRRARARIEGQTGDVGRRMVGLDRIDAAIRELERSAVTSSCRRSLVRTLVPTSWAMGTGGSALMFLSDLTPGPVLGQPWRTLAGLAAAGATSSLLTIVQRRD